MTGYGAGLFEQHQALLAASAIPPDIARERGYVSVDTKARLTGLGFSTPQRRVPGLLIPIWDERGQIALHQYRPDSPRRTDAGRPVKYETPSRARMMVDVPPRVRGRLGDPKAPLWLTEGVRKADAAAAAGLACLGLLGVWNWRGANTEGGKVALAFWESVALNDRQVCIAFDSDVMLNRAVHHALIRLGALLRRRGAAVGYVYLPAGPGGAKVGLDDYLAGGGTIDGLIQRARAEPLEPPLLDPDAPESPPAPAGRQQPDARGRQQPDARPRTLPDVLATFRKWLDLPDPGSLYVILATVAANLLRGDPVWLLVVGAPGSGKSEQLQAILHLPNVHPAATLTEPALLSGTPARDQAKGAKGGLLREIGSFGILLCKDFGSVLSMHRDLRAAVLASLREIYDGAWTRHLGVDGGRKLHWEGKIGLLAGCTPSIDSHHAVMGAMGERFVLYRLPDADERTQARQAIAHAGREGIMRAELAQAVAGLFLKLDLPDLPPPLDDADQDRLIDIATIAVRCRSAVERDRIKREIELIPQPEAPARLALVLVRLLAGLTAIGVDRAEAWRLIVKVALDSMPALRRRVLQQLAQQATPQTTTDLATSVGYPSTTARRALEDLAAHGVLERASQGQGKADLWSLSTWAKQRWKATVPAMSGGEKNEHEHDPPSTSISYMQNFHSDIAGTPPDDDAPPLLSDADAPEPDPSEDPSTQLGRTP